MGYEQLLQDLVFAGQDPGGLHLFTCIMMMMMMIMIMITTTTTTELCTVLFMNFLHCPEDDHIWSKRAARIEYIGLMYCLTVFNLLKPSCYCTCHHI
jgi:hypothetical protein